jgi:hypothetical protein
MTRRGKQNRKRPSSRVLRVEDLPPEILEQLAEEDKPKKPPKYKNSWVEIDGVKFQSKREAARWGVLKLMEQAGEISDLRRQVRYRLEVNGLLICCYICDFNYTKESQLVCEDVKGLVLPIFKLKQRLMKACLNIDVKIV